MAERLRALIVDDEPPALARLAELLSRIADVDVVARCSSGPDGLAQIRALKPDLAFLDIQMPDLDGFGILEALAPEERPAGLVFVTAYDRYAVRAFELNAIDYVLKPYTAERFAETLQRARSRLQAGGAYDARIDDLLRAVARRNERNERLGVRTGDGVQFVKIDDIDWLQSERNYTLLHIGQSVLRMRETLSDLEERLATNGFIRIHRSIIVNADRIFRIEPWGSGDHLVILRDGTKIQTGRGYDERLKRLFA